jgi:pimeloyl-ACP methyl ester carboxylesterase
VLLTGGGQMPCTHRNRMWVHLARRLADEGHHAVRFDYHGVGESSGSMGHVNLDKPFVGDLLAVIEWLRGQGLSEIALVGNCFGARTALATARSDIRGVALLTMPIRAYVKGEAQETRIAQDNSLTELLAKGWSTRGLRVLSTPRGRRMVGRVLGRKVTGRRRNSHRASPPVPTPLWASPGVAEGLAALAAAEIPLLVAYGERDNAYADVRRACETGWQPLIDRPGAALVTVPGNLNGYSSLVHQDWVVSTIAHWVTALASQDVTELMEPRAKRSERR